MVGSKAKVEIKVSHPMEAAKTQGTVNRRIDESLPDDGSRVGELLMREQDRLLRMVRLRMDPRLRGRVDAGDVVQEAFIEAMARYAEYQSGEGFPFFLWLRFLTMQTLCKFHRRHLGVQARNVAREVSLQSPATPKASSAALADQLAGKLTSPTQAAVRGESRQLLEEALQSMDPIDREVLVLRHFEQLSNSETACVLEIDESAASNRHVRALRRLKGVLGTNTD